MMTLTRSNPNGLEEYACISSDIPDKLPMNHKATGSTVLAIDTEKVYFWDDENKHWYSEKTMIK